MPSIPKNAIAAENLHGDFDFKPQRTGETGERVSSIPCKSHAETKCARTEGIGLPERVARTAKRPQGAARTQREQEKNLFSHLITLVQIASKITETQSWKTLCELCLSRHSLRSACSLPQGSRTPQGAVTHLSVKTYWMIVRKSQSFDRVVNLLMSQNLPNASETPPVTPVLCG